MAIRLSGLSSGLDTETLVTQLMQLERKPLYQIQDRQTLLQSRKDDLSSIKSKLFMLQTKITDLTYNSTFAARTTATTDDKVVTASAQNSSANASYVIDVTSMATTTRNTGSALALGSGTKATMLSTAELNINLGSDANPNAAFSTGVGGTGLETAVNAGYFYINNKRIDVTANDTINTVLNKINESAAGVTASFSGDKITLTQKAVGQSSTITLGTDTSGFLAAAKLSTATVTAGINADENRLLKDTALDATLTDGYFSINGTFFSVDKNTDTLSSLINKINASTTAGVTAFYDPTSKKISLTSKTVGAKDIVLGTSPGTDTSNFLSQVGLIQGNQVMGADASVKVNGVAVTATNNVVSLNGITFNIKSAGTATVTVKNDVDSMMTKIKDFVTQYNAVIDSINEELTETKAKEVKTNADLTSGNLRGDSLLVSIRSNLRSFTYATVSSQPAWMQQLSQIGISTGAVGSSADSAKTGHLVIDETKLRNALETDPQNVATLFGKGTTSVTDEAVGAGDGVDKTFTLAKTPVSTVPAPQIKVNGVVYTQVSGTPSSAAGSKEYTVNYSTGEIIFGEAPPVGQNITATYDYDITSGSQAGLAVRMKQMIGELTRVGGTFDGRIGSKGSLSESMKYNEKRIQDIEARLKLRETALYRQFTALETQMSALKNQGNWLSSQLAGLPSWNTSSSK